MKNIKLKYVITILLMLSGIMAICFDSLSKGFVTFAPYGVDEYVYLRDMQGSSDDDSVLIGFFGIISIIISIIIFFIKNVIYVVRIGFLTFLFLFIMALLTGNDPINQLVINTIQYDHNIYLILWCTFLFFYTIFLVVLNIKQK